MFLLYMLDGGESEVTGSAAVCAADCVADLVYYAAEGERLVRCWEGRPASVCASGTQSSAKSILDENRKEFAES